MKEHRRHGHYGSKWGAERNIFLLTINLFSRIPVEVLSSESTLIFEKKKKMYLPYTHMWSDGQLSIDPCLSRLTTNSECNVNTLHGA